MRGRHVWGIAARLWTERGAMGLWTVSNSIGSWSDILAAMLLFTIIVGVDADHESGLHSCCMYGMRLGPRGLHLSKLVSPLRCAKTRVPRKSAVVWRYKIYIIIRSIMI